MSKSRARKFADMFRTSLSTVLEGNDLPKEDVSGLTAIETKATTNETAINAMHAVSTSGDYNDLINKPASFDPSTLTWADMRGETASSVNAWGGLRHQTNDGYIDFGPANSSYAHIYTDKPSFYFNKNILINGTSVANPPQTANNVGTYAWLIKMTASGSWSLNSTHAGSGLRYSSVGSNSYNNKDGAVWKTASGTPSGTWKAMCVATSGSNYEQAGLFIRIS